MSEQGMNNLEWLLLGKIGRRIGEISERFIWSSATPVRDVAMAEMAEHILPAQARKLKYKPVKEGQRWGQPWGTGWFRLRFRIPAGFRGETVALHFKSEGECIIFRDDIPVQALDSGRGEYIVADRARGGEAVELYIEAGSSGSFGDFNKRTMHQPEIRILNREVWDAFWDLSALNAMVDLNEQKMWIGERMLRALPRDDTRRVRILHGLDKAVDLFDYDNPTRAALREQAVAVRRELKPLYACKANASAQTFACLGHAHIDVAWLWPLSETVRKCGRTFSNVLELMKRYPEFKFVQSQPHLYEFTKQRYPALYRQIKEKTKTGQWVPTGCMWVEADCNVTSGESLVRQVLFGTRFFRKELGVNVEDLWLPDVFGYSAALPQILRRSGMKYFLTQKISWSQFTRFPYHSFWWEGLDGTTVLTHFPPVDDYNSQLEAKQMLSGERIYQEKDRASVQVVPFGFGDGGGGPTAAMLERRRRYHDLEGMPKLRCMSTQQFFRQLERESKELPRWVGELYLEMHRGTYTTQSYNKRFNRLSELRLRDAEILSALALAAGGRYDQKRLNEAWKLVLLNQFHDIIPGSSIDEVYEDSDRHYAEILATARTVKMAALASLARTVDTRGKGVPVLAFNSLSWARKGLVEVDGLKKGKGFVATDSTGVQAPVQVGADGKGRFIGDLPSVGHSVFHVSPGKVEAPPIPATTRAMENDLVRVEFDAKGRMSSLFDKRARRQVLAPGAVGNQFIVFEDKMATCGAAWDMEIFYNDKPIEFDGRLASAKAVEQGPVRSVIRFIRKISKSTIIQDVVLAAGSARVDFVTRIDWAKDEKDVILKVAFPVNVHAAKARYEIQFGSVERPTHWNRSADFGMFEVPAHKWADLSEGDFGVALLNDCKYGHDTHGNVMRLTLLRAPKSPGKTADVGKTHQVTYSILPHSGTFENGVVRAGYELNVPVIADVVTAHRGNVPACLGRLSISGDNVVIDTVKKAEDDGGIVVRLYEAHGARGVRTLAIGWPVKKVVETNLMEKEECALPVRDGEVEVDFKPFQIVTLKLMV